MVYTIRTVGRYRFWPNRYDQEFVVSLLRSNAGKTAGTARVTIYGRDYELSSGESEDYARRIAAYVDEKMGEIATASNLSDPTRLAILAAMDISDQLIQRRERMNQERARTEDAVGRLGRIVDEA